MWIFNKKNFIDKKLSPELKKLGNFIMHLWDFGINSGNYVNWDTNIITRRVLKYTRTRHLFRGKFALYADNEILIASDFEFPRTPGTRVASIKNKLSFYKCTNGQYVSIYDEPSTFNNSIQVTLVYIIRPPQYRHIYPKSPIFIDYDIDKISRSLLWKVYYLLQEKILLKQIMHNCLSYTHKNK